MQLSAIWRRVALVRTDISDERIASMLGVKRISELGTALAVTGRLQTRPTRRHIPKDDTLHSDRRKHLKSALVSKSSFG
jgi:hypothetical protein